MRSYGRDPGLAPRRYEVDGVSIDEATGDVTLAWSRGGFQGGRGWQVGDDDKKGTIDPLPPLYVENVLAELDEYDEWYFDNDTQTLYYAHNGTGAPPDDWTFVSPELARLVGVVGSQEAPVQNVTIRGLGFRDARITYLDDWGVPSGGDWALHRGAAVFLEGVEGASVEASKFERVDGNAVLVSGYARSVVLQNNEFAWVGDCAMAAWGRTDDWDATKGDFPRGTLVKNNYAHELGVYRGPRRNLEKSYFGRFHGEYPRRGRGAAAARLRGRPPRNNTSTSQVRATLGDPLAHRREPVSGVVEPQRDRARPDDGLGGEPDGRAARRRFEPLLRPL